MEMVYFSGTLFLHSGSNWTAEKKNPKNQQQKKHFLYHSCWLQREEYHFGGTSVNHNRMIQ